MASSVAPSGHRLYRRLEKSTRLQIRESPSLKCYFQDEWLSQTYTDARYRAAIETQLDLQTFPENNPYVLNQRLDLDVWPNN